MRTRMVIILFAVLVSCSPRLSGKFTSTFDKKAYYFAGTTYLFKKNGEFEISGWTDYTPPFHGRGEYELVGDSIIFNYMEPGHAFGVNVMQLNGDTLNRNQYTIYVHENSQLKRGMSYEHFEILDGNKPVEKRITDKWGKATFTLENPLNAKIRFPYLNLPEIIEITDIDSTNRKIVVSVGCLLRHIEKGETRTYKLKRRLGVINLGQKKYKRMR